VEYIPVDRVVRRSGRDVDWSTVSYVRTVLITVVGSPGESSSELALALSHRVVRDNLRDDVELDVVAIDVDDDPSRAVELGVLITPTTIVTVDGEEYDRLAGVQSHRAILQSVLPVVHPAEQALHELRRQLDSPGERFPRRVRRRTGRLSQRRRQEMLRGVGLFGVLTTRQVRALATSAHEIVLDADTTVIEEGQPGDSFFVVVDGDVEVSSDGRPIARLASGECFGEMSLLDDLPRSATVTTRMPTTLLAIDRSTFQTLVLSSPQIALALMTELALRLRDAQSD
jgi:Cyclic nucleotide-binding domain